MNRKRNDTELQDALINRPLKNKIDDAIYRLLMFQPKDGYYLAFSGGKDSIVLKKIADMARVKYEAHYSVTTVDPPELVYFIREHHKDVIFNYPERTMWQLIVDRRMPPTRIQRYCCEHLKECHGVGRVTITGVRWDESIRRKQQASMVKIGDNPKYVKTYNDDNSSVRKQVEFCYKRRKTVINPIIDWTDEDVWQFIHDNNLPYCKLYDEGWKRIGCIGCPLSNREEEFERYPHYKRAYIRAFQKMIDKRKEDGLEATRAFVDGQTCFDWWVSKESAEDFNVDSDNDVDDYLII